MDADVEAGAARGWVRVSVPAPWRTLALWRVSAGVAEGSAGDLLAVPPGERTVRIDATFTVPPLQAEGRIEVGVHVLPGCVSELSLPLAALLGGEEPAR